MLDGYGFIPGKGRAKAIRLLSIAEEQGLPVEVIRATHQGYEVPESVLDAFDADLRQLDEAIEAPESEPYVPDTLAESEDKGYHPSTPDTSRIKMPKLNAAKAKWLAYAELRPGYTEADAELSRDELAAKYGD